MKIVRRAVDPESDLPDTLNPVLRRVFAGRGVLSADQVDHSLARLLPFETLTSIGTAAEMLSNANPRRPAHHVCCGFRRRRRNQLRDWDPWITGARCTASGIM